MMKLMLTGRPGLRTVLVASAAALVLAAIPGLAQAATTWSVTHPPFAKNNSVPYVPLNAIAAVSAADVWAVGEDTGVPLVEHWDGTAWSASKLPAGPCSTFEAECVLTSVGASSSSDVIATGYGIIPGPGGWISESIAFDWNGTKWQQMTLPAGMSSGALEHVQVFSPGDAWAVGTASTAASQLVVASHWDGTSWTQMATPFATKNGLSVSAISGSSASDIWAVGLTETGGYSGKKFTSVALHYDGTQWAKVAVPDQKGLKDVSAVAPGDAWAIAANGGVLQWNGTAWRVQKRLGLDFTQICALSGTDVWVAGVAGLAHFDGSAWTRSPLPAGIDELTGHAALAPSAAWFSGYYYPANGDTDPAVLATTTG
jgi:hypothetical protein